ncbi:coiled-coil-helix-coiled-coil-helix domain-containing protein 1 [Vespula squamosa]|uniref:Coiled-coil-helix-coiled-coil-helix domain-containing protein 1 n=1 Tax=Vespula squamosa TaxID=30214 RepID=A0ABD2A0H5_VESSQ
MRFSLACFNGRRPQSEKKVPFKVLKPLELSNRVSQKGSDVSGKGCLPELTILLTCLREKEFDNFDCTKELKLFEQCNKKFAKLSKDIKSLQLQTMPVPNSKVHSSKQISYLLNLYPVR